RRQVRHPAHRRREPRRAHGTGRLMGAGATVSPLSAGSLAQLTLSLLFIVGLIFAISWLLKRFRIAVPNGRGEMSVLDEVAVGPRGPTATSSRTLISPRERCMTILRRPLRLVAVLLGLLPAMAAHAQFALP